MLSTEVLTEGVSISNKSLGIVTVDHAAVKVSHWLDYSRDNKQVSNNEDTAQ